MSRPQLSRSKHAVGGLQRGWEADLSGNPIRNSGDRANVRASGRERPGVPIRRKANNSQTVPRLRVPRSLTFPVGSSTPKLNASTDAYGFHDGVRANLLASTVSPADGERSTHSASSRSGSSLGANSATSSVGSTPSPASSVSPFDMAQSDDGLAKRESLNGQIFSAMKECVLGDNTQFLPATEIERIINWENVSRELTNMPSEVISSVVSVRRQLFAILAMMGRSEAIHGLITEGIHDGNLPFEADPDDGDVMCYYYSKEPGRAPNKRAVESLRTDRDGWGPFRLQEFYSTYQWRVMARHFNVNCPHGDPPTAEIKHYELSKQEALPFTKPVGGDNPYHVTYVGRSMVRKVCIHPAHRNRCLHVKQVRCPARRGTQPVALLVSTGSLHF